MKRQNPGRPRVARRDFLRTSILASGYSLLWGWRRAAARSEKILVVGAGISGLAAARDLQSQGFAVTVLEGRQRTGGRIWTSRDLGVAVDLGASWIEGSNGNPITDLAEEHAGQIQRTNFDDVVVFDRDGRQLSDGEVEEIGEGFEKVLQGVEALANDLDRDISYAEAIERVLQGEDLSADEERALSWILSAAVVQGGAEMDELSLLYSDEDHEFGGDSYLFPGGYDQIVRGLGGGLDIRLAHRVSRVEHGSKGVKVVTNRGQFDADRALITLPLGVLKKGSVGFVPRLPASKRQSMERLDMGVLDKVVLRFPKRFWPKDPHFFSYMSDRAGEYPVFMNWFRYVGAPILMAFAGGNFARSIEDLSNEDVTDGAMGVLRKMFGNSIPEPHDGVRARWGRDPFAFGSDSHIPVGATPRDYDVLAEPVGDRLYFAGEATNRRYPATVHGAFLSGVREANRIAKK